jgi:hypothetical protein
MVGYSGRCGPRRPVHCGRRPCIAACVREGTQLLGCLCRQATWKPAVASIRAVSRVTGRRVSVYLRGRR